MTTYQLMKLATVSSLLTFTCIIGLSAIMGASSQSMAQSVETSGVGKIVQAPEFDAKLRAQAVRKLHSELGANFRSTLETDSTVTNSVKITRPNATNEITSDQKRLLKNLRRVAPDQKDEPAVKAANGKKKRLPRIV